MHELLASEQVHFSVKVPFWNKLDLKEKTANRQRWQRISDDIGYFESTLLIKSWQVQFRIVIYRKWVHHKSRKNYQLDLFDPDNGHWEYSAVATNMDLDGEALWYFMCGRSAHEKAYGELKTGFAFDTVASQKQHANSAWQLLSVLSFNLTRAFQATTIAPKRASNEKRTAMFKLSSIRTLRFQLLNRAGVVIKPQGQATLDVGRSPKVRNMFDTVCEKLDLAA